MFSKDPEKAAAKDALKAWRAVHPAEKTMNTAALLKMWPSAKMGVTSQGPVKGGSAEFVDAGSHKGWTATRLLAGGASMGMSAAVTGRKHKGAAVINVTFGNGAVQTFTVRPEPSHLRAANQYVTAFNALASQLDQEE